MITKFEYEVLAHCSDNGRYVTDEPTVIAMGERGLLRDHGPQALAGGAHYLVTTPSGRAALSEYRTAMPKLKPKRRSEQFESWRTYRDVVKRISFSDFLKNVWPNRHEYR